MIPHPPAHWATRFIGTPFDPVTDHCWAFARRVWREQFGLEVAEIDTTALEPRQVRRDCAGHAEFGAWQPVADPAEGDLVIMARGRHPCHVGIWLDPAAVLHCVEGIGGIATPVTRLGDLGYRLHGVHRRRGT